MEVFLFCGCALFHIFFSIAPSYAYVPKIESNVTTEHLHVIGPPPHGIVFLLMETENVPMIFNFSVRCDSVTSKYVLKVASENAGLMTFRDPNVLIDCKHRILTDDPHVQTLNVKTVPYSTNNSPMWSGKGYFVEETVVLSINSELLGRTFINFTLLSNNSNKDVTLVEHKFIPVVINRVLRPVDHAFQYIIYIFLILVTLAFGAKLDLEVVKENIKRPIAPAIGLIGQFVIMPMIGYGIAKLVIPERPDVCLGIFVSGICPGGGASNIYSYLLGGDLSLSITMTALSTILALGMMPLWLFTLGSEFTTSSTEVPFLNIFTTLLILIVPLFVGVFMKRKLPKITKIFLKVTKPTTVVCIILLLTVGIYSNLYIFKLFEPKIVLAGCLLPYCGYILGGVIALIVRLPWERVKTVSIETGMQNTGIAMVLMLYAFPPPDGFIASVAPIASAVMTPLPVFVITIPYLIYRRCNKDKYKNVPTDSEKDTTELNNTEEFAQVENGKKPLEKVEV